MVDSKMLEQAEQGDRQDAATAVYIRLMMSTYLVAGRLPLVEQRTKIWHLIIALYQIGADSGNLSVLNRHGVGSGFLGRWVGIRPSEGNMRYGDIAADLDWMCVKSRVGQVNIETLFPCEVESIFDSLEDSWGVYARTGEYSEWGLLNTDEVADENGEVLTQAVKGDVEKILKLDNTGDLVATPYVGGCGRPGTVKVLWA